MFITYAHGIQRVFGKVRMTYTHSRTPVPRTFTKKDSIHLFQRLGSTSLVVVNNGHPPTIHLSAAPHSHPSPDSWLCPPPQSPTGWPGWACSAAPCCASGSACISAWSPLCLHTVGWGQPNRGEEQGHGKQTRALDGDQQHSCNTHPSTFYHGHIIRLLGTSISPSIKWGW